MVAARLLFTVPLGLFLALPTQAQTSAADLVGTWAAKQAIEERCYIHLGQGNFRIAPASRRGVYTLSGRLTYHSAVRPECQGTAAATTKAARNTTSSCQVTSNKLVCKTPGGRHRSFEIGNKTLVSTRRTPQGANVTTILRKQAKKTASGPAAPAAKITSGRAPPPEAEPVVMPSDFRQATGARPALPESAANTALAVRIQKAQNHLDKAAESLFRGDLAATSSTTTQQNELSKARAYLKEYGALLPTLTIPGKVRNPVLRKTMTAALRLLKQQHKQVRHFLAVSEALQQATREGAMPSAAYNAAGVLDRRLARATLRSKSAREFLGFEYFQSTDYFLMVAGSMMADARVSLHEGLKNGANRPAARGWAVDARKRAAVGRLALDMARSQEKKSSANLALIPDKNLKAKFAEFMRLSKRYNDLLDEALQRFETAANDLESGSLKPAAIDAIDANYNFLVERLLGRLSEITTELSRLVP
ncbi:MAG: hypothetical protein QF546_13825 [Alphaproteobacteria bacterium]|jgi:hypothetical protein|nr:hypothetical protein [Alphaproteobacteria bacterium]